MGRPGKLPELGTLNQHLTGAELPWYHLDRINFPVFLDRESDKQLPLNTDLLF